MRRSPRPGVRGRQLTLGTALLVASMVIWAIVMPAIAYGGALTGTLTGAPWAVAPVAARGAPVSSRPPGGSEAIPFIAGTPGSGTGATPAHSGRPGASSSPAVSPSPSAPPAPALATDTVSLFGFVCADPGGADRVVYSRNPAMADPADGCRTARSGELSIIVTDPADPTVRYDRVQTGPDGYANAVVPVGRPFVFALGREGEPVTRAEMSPVYRLNARPDRREPISVRIFQLSGPGANGTPTASDPNGSDAGTPGAGTADSQPITIIGMICVSETRAGIYDYLPGADQPALDGEQCRRATIDELEFLLLDNDNASTLYDDAMTGIDGAATADAPAGRPFFVTEFSDDPGVETGLPGGSLAITIPRDRDARQPVVLTVVRNVAPGALDLPAGTMMLSTVVCPPRAGAESLTVLGPAPTILIRPEGASPVTPQPGSAPGCGEATGRYEIASYGDDVVPPIEVGDDADDGALIVPLPATLAVDGTRVFDPYRITETSTGQSATFDIQEGAWTSLRVVLVDRPATPVAADDATPTGSDAGTPEPGPGASGDVPVPGTPAAPGVPGTGDPAAISAATAAATAAPDENESAGLSYSPVRLLWATLAVLAIGIFLVGAWVLRRPGHRWRRRAGS